MDEGAEPTLVHLESVAYAYAEDVVLDQVTLGIDRRSLVGIVGPSGSGKTTLLKILGGVLDPIRGSRIAAAGMRIGYVPQVETVNWYFPVTVDEVVLMGSPERRIGIGYTKHERNRAHNLLHDLGIGHFEHRHIRELSGGQQQRVFIARALMADPDLVLLDEPMSGVDVKTRQDVLEILSDLTHQGVAVVLTTHDLNGVAAHLPYIVCVKGRVVAEGPPGETLVPSVLLETFGAEMELIEHEGHPIVIDKHPPTRSVGGR
ncbi:MAG: metal ABC transporter ATP-binding protein [Actinomycetia bacterium]|nr:metal ABC transporter ATP-binding protein [Actinomycetes bacterium]